RAEDSPTAPRTAPRQLLQGHARSSVLRDHEGRTPRLDPCTRVGPPLGRGPASMKSPQLSNSRTTLVGSGTIGSSRLIASSPAATDVRLACLMASAESRDLNRATSLSKALSALSGFIPGFARISRGSDHGCSAHRL